MVKSIIFSYHDHSLAFPKVPIVMYLLNSFQVSSNLVKSMMKPQANVSIDLYIFKELISRMSGFEMPNTLNES